MLDHGIPLGLLDLEDVPGNRQRGVVHPDVDAAVTVDRCRQAGLDRVEVADVELDPERAGCRCRGLRTLRIDVGVDDVVPVAGESVGDRLSEPSCGSGDDGDATLRGHAPNRFMRGR